MKKDIKIIALDLDGTLLMDDKTISQANKEAIKAAKEAGITVVLCTGRPLKGVLTYLEELNLLEDTDYCVTYNGGLIQKTKSGEILYEVAHSKEDMLYAYEETQKVDMPLVMIDLEAAYETTYPASQPSYYPNVMKAIPFKQANPWEVADDHLFNKAVICVAPEAETALNLAIDALPSTFYKRFNGVKSRAYLFEILPKQVSKGSALLQLAEILGCTAENIMACGDEENDLAMLEIAGFAVAMGNATPIVKAAAHYVTGTNEESGVAQAIHYILED